MPQCCKLGAASVGRGLRHAKVELRLEISSKGRKVEACAQRVPQYPIWNGGEMHRAYQDHSSET